MTRVTWQLPLPLERENSFSIDNLVITKSNAPVFRALENWPDWQGGVTLLIGGTKTGKSHMAACWIARSFGRTFTPHHLQEATECVATGMPILIEDIDKNIHTNPFDETALFHLINSVREARITHKHASLLITARTHPTLWHITLPDLASRLRAVQLLDIPPPDDMLLGAVLTKLFADRQLKIESHVIRVTL